MLVLLASSLYAQQDSHMQAVNEFIEVTQMKGNLGQASERMINLQIEAMPQMAQFKDVLIKFHNKYVTWDRMSDKIKNVYKKNYTEQEIRDIIAFYKTDTGQKFAKRNQKVAFQIMRISQQQAMKHQAKLREMIMNAVQSDTSSGLREEKVVDMDEVIKTGQPDSLEKK